MGGAVAGRLHPDRLRARAAAKLREGFHANLVFGSDLRQFIASDPHPAEYVVPLDEMMPQRADDVHREEQAEQVGNDHVRFFEKIVQAAVD